SIVLCGRESRKSFGQDAWAIAVSPLLEGTDGEQKRSKSPGNYLGLGEPPEEIYGKTMSITDSLIEKYMALISGLDICQVHESRSLHPRDRKAMLAYQLVKRLHGDEAARRAEADFELRFRQRGTPEEMRDIRKGADLVSTMVDGKLATSRGEARRLVQQGGVRVNGTKVDADHQLKEGDVIQIGRRQFARIVG